jgi:hypothetical protein
MWLVLLLTAAAPDLRYLALGDSFGAPDALQK